MQTSAEEAAKRQLLKEGFTTQSEYNQALKALQTAQADLANAQANVRLAEDQLGYATLKSPVAGAVTADRGRSRPGHPGRADDRHHRRHRARSTRCSRCRRSLPTSPRSAASSRSGCSRTPTSRSPARSARSRPSADPTTGTYTIKVGLDNPPAEMRLGALVRGRAEQAGDEVISIPPTALVQTGDKPQVWIVSADGSVHLKPVTVARYDTGAVLISDGIAKGDLVVIAGVNSLAEGQVVTVEKVAAP